MRVPNRFLMVGLLMALVYVPVLADDKAARAECEAMALSIEVAKAKAVVPVTAAGELAAFDIFAVDPLIVGSTADVAAFDIFSDCKCGPLCECGPGCKCTAASWAASHAKPTETEPVRRENESYESFMTRNKDYWEARLNAGVGRPITAERTAALKEIFGSPERDGPAIQPIPRPVSYEKLYSWVKADLEIKAAIGVPASADEVACVAVDGVKSGHYLCFNIAGTPKFQPVQTMPAPAVSPCTNGRCPNTAATYSVYR